MNREVIRVSDTRKNETFICSDTKLTATWEKTQFGSYRCTNCGHTESYGYPVRHLQLGRFCPTCGFNMTNPGIVVCGYDYDDDYY